MMNSVTEVTFHPLERDLPSLFICSVAYVAARWLCMGSAVGKPGE